MSSCHDDLYGREGQFFFYVEKVFFLFSSPTPDEFGPPAPLLRTGGKKLDLVPSDDPPRARGGLCLHFLKSTRSPLHQYKGRPEKMF